MAQVSKDFFFDGMVLPVTVYLKLRENNYLVIGQSGEKSNFSMLHSYKNPNSMIFVTKQNLDTLINFVAHITNKILNQKNIPATMKTRFLVGLTENALEAFAGKGFSSVTELQRVSHMIIEMGKNISDFNEVLSVLSNLKDEDAKHSMTVCMVSVMICEEMEMTLKGAIEKVALGSLLHDVGLRYLPKKLLDKPRHRWTAEDHALYESHPLKGVEMLRDLKEISQDVLLIIAEHHENAMGTGFPKRIRDVKISPLSRIVIVANYFSDLILSRFEGGKVYTADQAITYMTEIMGQPFNKQVFSALRTIVRKNDLREKLKAE